MKANKSLKKLFVSNTRQKLINLFFYSPDSLYYVRQLVRLAGEEINSVRRELLNLKNADLIESEWRGNRLYYWANKKSALFPVLAVLANKTFGLGEKIDQNITKLGQIHLLALSYDFLINESAGPNDIDFVLVGNIDLKVIQHIVKQEESHKGREINYMVMTKQEFRLRKNKRDPFIVDFFINCPLVIMGNPKNL